LFNGLSRENRSAYVDRCACDSAPDGRVQGTVVDHVRLFPLRADVLWTYPVHEQILPALRRAGVPVEWTDIVVRHTGYVDEAVRRQNRRAISIPKSLRMLVAAKCRNWFGCHGSIPALIHALPIARR
jgi:hypothetical protein